MFTGASETLRLSGIDADINTSQLTEFASSLQPDHAKDDAVVSRRAAYAAFGWVLAFLAWHVVWAVTGLGFPQPSHHHGAARMLFWAFDVIGPVLIGKPGTGKRPRAARRPERRERPHATGS